MGLLNKVEKELQKEADKCIDLCFRSVILALHRHEGWGVKRLDKFVGELKGIYAEVGNGVKSSVGMLDEETGIELQCGDGKHWYDLQFMKSNTWDEALTNEKRIAIRLQQKKWLKTSFIASILLAMHRLYGWSTERDLRLMNQMDDIETENNYDPKKLDQCMIDELGIKLVHKGTNVVSIVFVNDEEKVG